ncbi:type I-B CRISPR-associated protein Cas7/Csh2 [Algoriphagus sp. NG3]|uniref:type I-B CRISPR-associated protein Cas7/Csh2 n=1 Tax=Algoriphagus sp. NG3 TaxID=3097546 RepID=UPI002A81888A|nr:type I-B CRISPR-associated protein Cas7/Csh2 [Algoriphagus sp. NG3]WPR77955.1 type I-B CRISPR-associated protein Cas7/Csh2 [Algoriphagus sp. NG3]
MSVIQNNSDFLFLYEAINCNPNGDPDQENKPRMDYDTQTNLVTDTRLKRYIRDYFMQEGFDVFVAMEEGSKVNPDTKFVAVVEKLLAEPSKAAQFFEGNEDMAKAFMEIIKEKKDSEGVFKALQNKKNKKLNYFILEKLVRDTFLDIRLFGSAFAVKEFTRAYTGPVQINWGYSLNKVYQIDSNSIVTIMNDDSSTFGKDYRVHYSLLSFHGVVNKHSAKTTGLSSNDMEKFRDGIWNAIPSLPTRSKLNQYPKLYLEIIYNDGYHNGHFGDLRNYVKCEPNTETGDFKKVRNYNNLDMDFSALEKLIADNKGSVIKDVIIKTAEGISFNS